MDNKIVVINEKGKEVEVLTKENNFSELVNEKLKLAFFVVLITGILQFILSSCF